jgi:hypothetical protein
MEDVIKDLQDKQLLVIEYLNKTYEVIRIPDVKQTEHIIQDEVWLKADVCYKLEIYDTFHEHQIYGKDLESELLMMFGFGEYLTKVVLYAWLDGNGLRKSDEDAWAHAWGEITTKLKVQWTPEMAQDLAAFHAIDAEAELTRMLSEHVADEINRDIITNVQRLATEQSDNNRGNYIF